MSNNDFLGILILFCFLTGNFFIGLILLLFIDWE